MDTLPVAPSLVVSPAQTKMNRHSYLNWFVKATTLRRKNSSYGNSPTKPSVHMTNYREECLSWFFHHNGVLFVSKIQKLKATWCSLVILLCASGILSYLPLDVRQPFQLIQVALGGCHQKTLLGELYQRLLLDYMARNK